MFRYLIALIAIFAVTPSFADHGANTQDWYRIYTYNAEDCGNLRAEAHESPLAREIMNLSEGLQDCKINIFRDGYGAEDFQLLNADYDVFSFTYRWRGSSSNGAWVDDYYSYSSQVAVSSGSCPAGTQKNPYTQYCQPECPDGTEGPDVWHSAALSGQRFCNVNFCEVAVDVDRNDGTTFEGIVYNRYGTEYTGEMCGTIDIPSSPPDGTTTTTTTDPDGTTTTTTTDPDGSTTTTTTTPDGTSTTVYPDGTSTTTNTDGSTTSTDTDGTVTETDTEGNTTSTETDGTVTETETDGTTTVTEPDGTSTTTAPDGSSTVTSPGGNTTVNDPDGNTTSITDGDGNLVCDNDPSTSAPDCSNDVCIDDPNTSQDECAGDGNGDNNGDGDGECVDDPNTTEDECADTDNEGDNGNTVYNGCEEAVQCDENDDWKCVQTQLAWENRCLYTFEEDFDTSLSILNDLDIDDVSELKHEHDLSNVDIDQTGFLAASSGIEDMELSTPLGDITIPMSIFNSIFIFLGTLVQIVGMYHGYKIVQGIF